jgi:hypothetical protein
VDKQTRFGVACLTVKKQLQKKQAKFRIIVLGDRPLINEMRTKISLLGLKNIELKGFKGKKK